MDLFSSPAAPLAHEPAAAAFVAALAGCAPLPHLCNPWSEASVDSAYDCTPLAAQIRRAQLTAYLSERLNPCANSLDTSTAANTTSANYTTKALNVVNAVTAVNAVNAVSTVLIAEAPGYQGARFSGLAMTSERILLGQHAAVRPDAVFHGAAQRTSRADTTRGGEQGMNEPTATVVWSHLLQAGFAPRSFVLWNTVAFHPHHAGQPMSNRTPTPLEIAACAPLLHAFLALFPAATVVALGRIAQRTLADLGVAAHPVRHPSMGGAAQFRSQMALLNMAALQ
jgi:Uracil DNA glycosylase superfamily